MDLQSTKIADQDWQLLSQLMDGELDSDRDKALQQRLAEEPALRGALHAMRELNSDLCELLYRHPGVPPRIEEQLRDNRPSVESGTDSNNVLRFPQSAQTARRQRRSRWPVAAAASVVLAVAASTALISTQRIDGTLPGNDALVAAALETQASGEWQQLDDGRAVQPVLSFAHRDGTWCREFLLRGGNEDWRAVACREAGSWSTQAAGLESYLESGASYRPAGASDSAPVAVFISQNAADIALDREQESSLIENGWR